MQQADAGVGAGNADADATERRSRDWGGKDWGEGGERDQDGDGDMSRGGREVGIKREKGKKEQENLLENGGNGNSQR